MLDQKEYAAVKKDIETNKDKNIYLTDGKTPLMLAVEMNDQEFVQELLELGADPIKTHQQEKLFSAITLAQDKPEILEILLESIAKISIHDTYINPDSNNDLTYNAIYGNSNSTQPEKSSNQEINLIIISVIATVTILATVVTLVTLGIIPLGVAGLGVFAAISGHCLSRYVAIPIMIKSLTETDKENDEDAKESILNTSNATIIITAVATITTLLFLAMFSAGVISLTAAAIGCTAIIGVQLISQCINIAANYRSSTIADKYVSKNSIIADKKESKTPGHELARAEPMAASNIIDSNKPTNSGPDMDQTKKPQ